MRSSDVTLCIVDTFNHALATHAIERSVSLTGIDKVVTWSDRPLFKQATHIQIDPITSIDEYSWIILKHLAPHVDTSHALVIQYDGYVANIDAWTDEFLEYDYVGAPWPWKPKFNMGNGGFSLRSKKLLSALQDPTIVTVDGKEGKVEDHLICHVYRKYLEKEHNIRFAPVELAARFSIETGQSRVPTFGFHGAWQIPFVLGFDETSNFVKTVTDTSLKSLSQLRLLKVLSECNHPLVNNMFARYCAVGGTVVQSISRIKDLNL